ncbi:hypothetical protein V1508DRAFT_413925 [Lipomyces doorenjongii]|uniref:uncharacterized protein n=1 Tax=Lipomyces doorenjongii TaxID=383834 RepID=UPI0034CD0865
MNKPIRYCLSITALIVLSVLLIFHQLFTFCRLVMLLLLDFVTVNCINYLQMVLALPNMQYETDNASARAILL